VLRNATYTAQWEKIVEPINTYTVTFVNWNGSILKIEQVESGDDATAPTDPTRSGYTFDGWDVSYHNVTADITVTAQYTAIPADPEVPIVPATPRSPIVVTVTPPSVYVNTPATTVYVPQESSPTYVTVDPATQILADEPGDVTTRQEPVDVEDDAEEVDAAQIGQTVTPLAGGSVDTTVWALANLIIAVMGIVLVAVIAVLVMPQRNREEKNSQNDKRSSKTSRASFVGLGLMALTALVGIVFFVLTEDMTRTMVALDEWTIINAIILAVELVVSVLTLMLSKRDEEEETRVENTVTF
jgi:uncharacterized membrane protein